MIRAVRFASCYVYSPIGSCETSECSRLLCSLLKAGDTRFILKYAVRVRQQASENPGLAGFFDAGDILIPVPRSVPRNRAGVSVTEHLAAALVSEGLGDAPGRVFAGPLPCANRRPRLRGRDPRWENTTIHSPSNAPIRCRFFPPGRGISCSLTMWSPRAGRCWPQRRGFTRHTRARGFVLSRCCERWAWSRGSIDCSIRAWEKSGGGPAMRTGFPRTSPRGIGIPQKFHNVLTSL